MRCRVFMLLMLCGVLATGLRAGPHPSARKGPSKRQAIVVSTSPAPADERLRRWSVQGRGKSSEDAEQDALEKAQGQVTTFLTNQNPPLDWAPPLNYVERLVTKRTAEEPEKILHEIGVTHQVRLDVELTAREYEHMRALDHKLRREHRLFWLAKVLALVVAVLAALAGYLRLDEATKGYYTTWLRLAAVGFAAAIAAGAWLLPLFKGRLTQ
jgi:hypothetical protein